MTTEDPVERTETKYHLLVVCTSCKTSLLIVLPAEPGFVTTETEHFLEEHDACLERETV
jgi:hypothetical protein